ncbi:GGDEF domain-containing protein [Arsukibacterium sp.]|uniref:tetratricopeptide repeat-containing diguanylate cyclase n=1 Tax=Arsukibacterium sp. TaxID=1977258 RepID=UPI00299D9D92|nr:GGDEF domain-containing protein [Arsukibacterium sp.]MDX1536323.1 GGDEF domain-containing protein [Arsukibacterium sp.]
MGIFLLCSVLVSAQVVAQQDELELQLDTFLQLAAKDYEQATALLLQLKELDAGSLPVATRVRLYSYLAIHYFDTADNKQTEFWLDQALTLATTTNDPDGLAEAYATEIEIIASSQQFNDAVVKAEQLHQLGIMAAAPRVRYYAHNLLGRIFRDDGQYELALEHFAEALQAVTETEDQRTLPRTMFLNQMIASIHADLKNFSEARTLVEQLISDAKAFNLQAALPEYYLLYGFIVSYQQQDKLAEQINLQGLAESQRLGQDNLALIFKNNLGAGYIQQGSFAKAREILSDALQQANDMQTPDDAHLIRFNLGYVDVAQGKHGQGLAAMQESIGYFRENNLKNQLEDTLGWLAKAYGLAGKHEARADTLAEQMALQQEILNTERDKVLHDLQSRYDTKAKAQQINLLKKDNDLTRQLLQNKQLQQKVTLLFIVAILFGALLLLQLVAKVRQANRRLKEANKKLEYQTLRDPLTGLFNRRALQEQMQRRANYGRRQSDSGAPANGFLLLDIDFFKRINDEYGHAAGDQVLTQLSARLAKACREQDLVVRWGGEEFLIYLDNISSEQVVDFCDRILKVVASEPVMWDGKLIPVSTSGGFIHLPFAGIDETELNWERALQIADMALYLSKVNGRNQVYAITGLHSEYEAARQLLSDDLQGAIGQNMVDYITIKGPTLAT